MKFYGSLENRLEENQNLTGEKVVGGLLTEFSWSDRKPYEITKVIDQKHIYIRELGHRKADEVPMSNNWELYQDVNNPEIELVYRYGGWCRVLKYTKDTIRNLIVVDKKLKDKIDKYGEAINYNKINVTFGYADYYYDYEF